MLIKRRKLGTVYDKSPAQRLRKWAAENASKIMFSVIGCFLWLIVLYVIVGIVNFLGGNVAEVWGKDLPTSEFYNHPYLAPVKLVGAALLILYMFRDVRKR